MHRRDLKDFTPEERKYYLDKQLEIYKESLNKKFEKAQKKRVEKSTITVKKNYFHIEPKYDFLKFWRVVRKWMMAEHKLNESELDILLRIYSEPFFTRTEYNRWTMHYGWTRVKLSTMIEKGFITEYKNVLNPGSKTYQISYTMTRKILSMYKKLNGLEPMSLTVAKNPFFAKSTNSYNKKFKPEMKFMNAYYESKNNSNITF